MDDSKVILELTQILIPVPSNLVVGSSRAFLARRFEVVCVRRVLYVVRAMVNHPLHGRVEFSLHIGLKEQLESLFGGAFAKEQRTIRILFFKILCDR